MNKIMMIAIAFIGLAIGTTNTATAQYYGNGSQYVQRGDYWYNSAGEAFKRTATRCRLRNGCWGTCWSYTPVTIDPQLDGATERLLQIAQERDRWEGKIRLESNRHNMFVEKLKELGMDKNFSWDGYGYQLRMADPYAGQQGYGQQQQQYPPTYADQGNTAWGMSQFTSPYNNMDPSLAMKQAADLTKNAQQLAGQGHTGFMDFATSLGNAQARVAEIQAQTALLQAAKPKDYPPTTQRFSFSTTLGENGQHQVQQQFNNGNNAPQGPLSDSLVAVIQNRCISCHGAQKVSGNVNMAEYLNFTRDQQKRVLEVITSCDPNIRMPKRPSPDGSGHAVGEPLTVDEIRLFFLGSK